MTRPVAFTAVLLAPLLLCISCQRSAIDPSQSLVGARKLPPADVLSREFIEMDRMFGDPGPRLILQLSADDSLTVTLTDWDRKQLKQFIVGKQLLRLSRDTAGTARRLLWRVRPENLAGMASSTQPIGCSPPPPDETPDYTVGFIADGLKSRVEDEHVGIFDVFPSCKAKNANLARVVLRRVLALLPQSPLGPEYDRRVLILRTELETPHS